MSHRRLRPPRLPHLRNPRPLLPRPSAGIGQAESVAAEIPLPGDPRPLAYRLYLPPCFDLRSTVRYPSLYLLHGLAQSEDEWIQLGVAAAADELILAGEAPAFVIVLPGERTGYDLLPAITQTLLPELESTLPIGGAADLRAIGGISRGAGWALRIGAQRPDLFGAIGMHSPAVISPDLFLLPDWVRAVKGAALPRLWLDIGYDDTLLPKALELRQALDKVRWPYTWSIERGEHSSSYWSAHLSTVPALVRRGLADAAVRRRRTRNVIASVLPGRSCQHAPQPGAALEGG